jgi:hypothetical protein
MAPHVAIVWQDTDHTYSMLATSLVEDPDLMASRAVDVATKIAG